MLQKILPYSLLHERKKKTGQRKLLAVYLECQNSKQLTKAYILVDPPQSFQYFSQSMDRTTTLTNSTYEREKQPESVLSFSLGMNDDGIRSIRKHRMKDIKEVFIFLNF